jgi:hypothetical protein
MPSEHDRAPAYLAPALARALDNLDTVWRLRFGRSQRLLVMPSVQSIASVELDCTTRGDFTQRLIALGDILGGLAVSNHLFDPEQGSDRWLSLRRLEAVLNKCINDEASRARGLGGVAMLRSVIALRDGSAHGGSTARLAAAKAERELGINLFPNESWIYTWNLLRSRITEAVYLIAGVIRDSI